MREWLWPLGSGFSGESRRTKYVSHRSQEGAAHAVGVSDWTYQGAQVRNSTPSIVRFIKNVPHASGSHTPDRRPFACLTD